MSERERGGETEGERVMDRKERMLEKETGNDKKID